MSHPDSQKYLRFACMKVYQFRVISFSLSTPRCLPAWVTLCRVTSMVKAYRCCLTSMTGRFITQPSGTAHPPEILLQTLDLVGFKLNARKSGLDLVHDIQFLGVWLCFWIWGELLSQTSRFWRQ